MQVILTSSNGKILTTGATEGNSEADSTSNNDDGESRVSSGEGITYLYRYLYVCDPRICVNITFRIREGLVFNSHAAMCAELFGVPRAIVERAKHVR